MVFTNQPVFACSMAPGAPDPSPPNAAEKFNSAKSAFMVKVLGVETKDTNLKSLINRVRKLNVEKSRLLQKVDLIKDKSGMSLMKLNRMIPILERRILKNPPYGPVEIEVEIIKIYKGDRVIGETFIVSDQDSMVQDSCGLGGNSDLMRFISNTARPNHVAVLFGSKSSDFEIEHGFWPKEILYRIGLFGKQQDRESIDKTIRGYSGDKTWLESFLMLSAD